MSRWPFENFAFLIARQAQLVPDRIALRTPVADYSFGDLDERAARCAGALLTRGVGPGDRVAALLNNGVEYVDLLLACARLGAILVPLSTRLAPPELEYITNDSGARVLVFDAELLETVKAFGPATEITTALAVGAGEDPSYEDALTLSIPVESIERVVPDDVLAIFYTSGTTGRPKGAMLTHGNFFWTNLNIGLALDLQRDERSLVVLPMFHVGGWNVNTFAVWWKAGCVALESGFDAGRVLELVEGDGITSMMGVPAIYQALADHPRWLEADLSSLRICVCGGAPLPLELIRRYHDRGLAFTQGYGLTEAAPNCLLLPPEDAVRKAGAAGRPYFFADVRVFDPDDRAVGPNETGEIVVRGPSVMKGYWRKREETQIALHGGWLRTGDIGQVDDEGYIYIVDRIKDMFISGGENVYPAEIEKLLAEHPAVAEAAVIGVPDHRWGEVGLGVIVLKEDWASSALELEGWLELRVGRFKVPRYFAFVESLPRNATGKVIKAELVARFVT